MCCYCYSYCALLAYKQLCVCLLTRSWRLRRVLAAPVKSCVSFLLFVLLAVLRTALDSLYHESMGTSDGLLEHTVRTSRGDDSPKRDVGTHVRVTTHRTVPGHARPG